MASSLPAMVAGVLGLLLLGHAAFLTASYRETLKLTATPFTFPPLQALAEVAVGLLFCLFAGVQGPGHLAPISLQADVNRTEALPDLLDFAVVNHRGAALPPSLQVKFRAKNI